MKVMRDLGKRNPISVKLSITFVLLQMVVAGYLVSNGVNNVT